MKYKNLNVLYCVCLLKSNKYNCLQSTTKRFVFLSTLFVFYEVQAQIMAHPSFLKIIKIVNDEFKLNIYQTQPVVDPRKFDEEPLTARNPGSATQNIQHV